jgi:hypothetical protein
MYILRFRPHCSFLTKILSVSLLPFCTVCVLCTICQDISTVVHTDTYSMCLSFLPLCLSLSCFLLYHLQLLCTAFIFISLSESHPFSLLYVNLFFLLAIFLCLPIILFSDVFPSVILSLSRFLSISQSIAFFPYHFCPLVYWLPVFLLKTANSMAAR